MGADLVKRNCAMCATPFEAQRMNARYCSPKCRQRAKRAGAAVPVDEPPPISAGTSSSGAAARAWLTEKNVDASRVPAAADLLVVADSIDAATKVGQIQFVAALARQAAALRAELTPATEEEGGDPGHGSSGGSAPGPEPASEPERRPFDAATL